MATEIRNSGFFNDIDVIMPIPLHRRKLRERGYNQSEWIARGIASVTKLPVDTVAISRKVYTSSQTNQSVFERWENVKDAFRIEHPEKYAGKHILLVDDVLTTGSTIVACASTFSGIENIRFSVITLGTSR